MKCKDCKYWKNNQAELDYDKYSGICVCYKWKFVTQDNPEVCVLDRQNLSSKWRNVSRFENVSKDVPVGSVEKSRYCLITNEDFGCINFESKEKPKK